jgi:hypothetical protein
MPFDKGQSGNPNGRPKGIPDKRVELRELLKPHAKVLIEGRKLSQGRRQHRITGVFRPSCSAGASQR